MKDLALESWQVVPTENVIYKTVCGVTEAFSLNTDPERAKLIEAAPDMLFLLQQQAKTSKKIEYYLIAKGLI